MLWESLRTDNHSRTGIAYAQYELSPTLIGQRAAVFCQLIEGVLSLSRFEFAVLALLAAQQLFYLGVNVVFAAHRGDSARANSSVMA